MAWQYNVINDVAAISPISIFDILSSLLDVTNL